MSWQHDQNPTTHVALVIDRSVSMAHLQNQVIRVVNDLVDHLAKTSKEENQDWRISLYTFGNEVDCHTWDMDVLRFQSMMKGKPFYHIAGNTALVDATLMALDDGDKITEHRGNHTRVVYVITDGQENWSKGKGYRLGYGRPYREELARQLTERINGLKDNVSVAVLAPDNRGVADVKELGFQNIALWDTTTEAGLEEAIRTIKDSATHYMTVTRTGDAAALRKAKTSLFVGGNVDAAAIKAANLTPLPTADRQIIRVTPNEDAFEKVVKRVTKTRLKPEMGWFVEIEKFIRRINEGKFTIGKAYYELVKTERIQGDKEIAVVEVNTNKVYVGAGARQLLGLPEERRTVKPEPNGKYQIFVQSSSTNRHLPIGSHVLLLK